MTIGIANDHRGYRLKKIIQKHLENNRYQVKDYGTGSNVEVDYPDYALLIGAAINQDEIHFGIVICGTGIGIAIACNKIKGLRCAKVDSLDEAGMTRLHNDANVLALNGNMDDEKALAIVSKFITTPFSNDERHIRRLAKIKKIEDDIL
jgi:ribose 5-phosphate isomerase B